MSSEIFVSQWDNMWYTKIIQCWSKSVQTHLKTEKEERINIRSSHSEKQLIITAARLSRIKTSQFVRQALLEKAQRVLAEASNFTLPKHKWEEFITALDKEPKEVPALKKLFEKKTLFD